MATLQSKCGPFVLQDRVLFEWLFKTHKDVQMPGERCKKNTKRGFIPGFWLAKQINDILRVFCIS